MPERMMRVQWEDGADLSQSRKQAGSFSPLTRDEDGNLGHVILSDIDDGEDDDSQVDPESSYIYAADEDSEDESGAEAVLLALGVLGVIVAAQKARPHVERWWNDRAVPFLKRSRRRFSRDRRAASDLAPSASATLLPSVPTESSQEVFAALDDYRASMSSAEARERFVAALVARLFSDEQLRVLRNARIADEEGRGLELASAVEAITPPQLAESITLMLEANPTWPDEETLVELERVLRPSSQGDGA